MFMRLPVSYEYGNALPSSESGEGGVENYRITRANFPSAPSPDGWMGNLDYWITVGDLRTKVRTIVLVCMCIVSGLILLLSCAIMAQGQS